MKLVMTKVYINTVTLIDIGKETQIKVGSNLDSDINGYPFLICLGYKVK